MYLYVFPSLYSHAGLSHCFLHPKFPGCSSSQASLPAAICLLKNSYVFLLSIFVALLYSVLFFFSLLWTFPDAPRHFLFHTYNKNLLPNDGALRMTVSLLCPFIYRVMVTLLNLLSSCIYFKALIDFRMFK